MARKDKKKLTINTQRKKEFSIRTIAKATHNLTWLEQKKKKRIEKMMETCPAFSSGNLFVLFFAVKFGSIWPKVFNRTNCYYSTNKSL
jgi:hypothetical protein